MFTNCLRNGLQGKMLGFIVGFAVLLIMVCPLAVGVGIAQTTYPTPAGYNDHDYQKLVAFLELSSDGVKHGERISSTYDPHNPATWVGAGWTTVAEEQRVSFIDWRIKSLSGGLDLSGCIALKEVHLNTNQLSSLNVSGCTALEDVDASNNQLSSLNVLGCTALKVLHRPQSIALPQ